MMADEGSDSEYDRGHLAGVIAERLASHDRHFATINGSLADVAVQLGKVALGMQRLADQADARDATAIALAAALKEKAETDRSRWTPVQVVLYAVLGVVGVGLSVWGLINAVSS
jgi:hypothetical protein